MIELMMEMLFVYIFSVSLSTLLFEIWRSRRWSKNKFNSLSKIESDIESKLDQNIKVVNYLLIGLAESWVDLCALILFSTSPHNCSCESTTRESSRNPISIQSYRIVPTITIVVAFAPRIRSPTYKWNSGTGTTSMTTAPARETPIEKIN